MSSPLPPLYIVMLGDVDSGKSTLIGRLIYETNNLTNEEVERLRDASHKRQHNDMRWAFATDALQEERDRLVTLGCSFRPLRLGGRACILIDAPGHLELRPLALAGASWADIAILVIDSSAPNFESTRIHFLALHFLGIEKCIVALNKIDLLQEEQDFRAREDCLNVLKERCKVLGEGLCFSLDFVSLSAQGGLNIVYPQTLPQALSHTPLQEQNPSLLATLHGVMRAMDGFKKTQKQQTDAQGTQDAIVAVQTVLLGDERGVVNVLGTLLQGRLRVKDRLMIRSLEGESALECSRKYVTIEALLRWGCEGVKRVDEEVSCEECDRCIIFETTDGEGLERGCVLVAPSGLEEDRGSKTHAHACVRIFYAVAWFLCIQERHAKDSCSEEPFVEEGVYTLFSPHWTRKVKVRRAPHAPKWMGGVCRTSEGLVSVYIESQESFFPAIPKKCLLFRDPKDVPVAVCSFCEPVD